MKLRVVQFLTLVFTALALSLTSAHVLEMPQKMGYSAALYSAVNTTLYKYFAIVGGVYSIGAVVLAIVLAWMVRLDRVAFRWSTVGAVCMVLWLVSWVAIVQPVNGQIAEALTSRPGAVPDLWMALRDRWEYGHAIGFLLELAGFAAISWSVIAGQPLSGARGGRA